MTFISLGTIDKKLIPISLGCIFAIAFELFILIDEINSIIILLVISYLFLAITKLLSFIPFLILKWRLNKSKTKSNVNNAPNEIEYIYIDAKKGIIRYKYLYILLSSLLSFFTLTMQVINNGLRVNSWIYDIIFYTIFYHFIFKIQFFKHHYLCIIIIIIIGFILDLSIGYLQQDLQKEWYLFPLRILREILYSLQEVIDKYIIEKKFCSVYELLLYYNVILNNK